MGYRVGGGVSSAFSKSCGWFWWKRSCAWVAGDKPQGYDQAYDDAMSDYPFGDKPSWPYHCTTCGKTMNW